jgi:hypothetical protein
MSWPQPCKVIKKPLNAQSRGRAEALSSLFFVNPVLHSSMAQTVSTRFPTLSCLSHVPAATVMWQLEGRHGLFDSWQQFPFRCVMNTSVVAVSTAWGRQHQTLVSAVSVTLLTTMRCVHPTSRAVRLMSPLLCVKFGLLWRLSEVFLRV